VVIWLVMHDCIRVVTVNLLTRYTTLDAAVDKGSMRMTIQ